MAKNELTNRPIAITGASSGIGAATAIACASAGMPVVLAARRTEKLDMLAQRITAQGGRALAVPCDVTKPDDCERLVSQTIETFGSIYSVFANAGFGEKHDVLDMPETALREMFEVNFFGTINTIRPAGRAMIEHKRGHILICSSCLSAIPVPGYSAYSATKSAQHHIGRALGVELAEANIHVTTVHPVRTKTEFFDTMHDRQSQRPKPKKDKGGQPPEWVAKKVVRALRRPKPEVWMSMKARHGFILAQHFPRLTDRILRRKYEHHD